MTLDAPIAINDHDYTSTEFRRAIVGFAGTHEDTNVSPRPGVLSGFLGSAFGTSIVIGSGLAIVSPGSDENGAYLVSNSGSDTLPLAPRDSTYTRWDSIYLRVYDDAVDGLGRNEVALEVAEGTPSASPSDPDLPPGALRLWRAVVPPGAAPLTTVDLRQKTTGPGGILPCTSTTRPTPSVLNAGFSIWETDTKLLRIWDGSAWVGTQPPAPVPAHGHVSVASSIDQPLTATSEPVKFPTAQTLEGGMTWNAGARAFVVPRAGRYSVGGQVTIGSGVEGTNNTFFSGRITVNGQEVSSGAMDIRGAYSTAGTARVIRLEAGDQVALVTTISSSAAGQRSIHTNAAFTFLTVSWVGE